MLTISEIINAIHEGGVEVEVFQALSEWIIKDREQRFNDVAKQRAIIKAIGKIAEQNPNKKNAIDGIRKLCGDEKKVDKKESALNVYQA